MPIDSILIVDDDEPICDFVRESCTQLGLTTAIAANGKEGIALLKERHFDLVFTDLKMPLIDGMELLKQSRLLSPSVLIVMMTGHGSIENAVEAMQKGAFHYIIKPFCADTIESVIKKANQHSSLVEENRFLRREILSPGGMAAPQFIATSDAMQAIIRDIEKVAKSSSSVLIQGESGTGKEMVAQAIHDLSLRANGPFIKVNCAAIPEALIESEFFGHEKGAFTGANQRRLGRFELANGGTLLLDELTETPLALQAKLLRVVQEGEFDRVGGTKPVKVDVRLISTTNRNIQEAIATKCLREDLYYRLNVIPFTLPPLRKRKEDVIPLAHYFLERFCGENRKKLLTLTKKAEERLLAYNWPGNVRELANIIERAVVMGSQTSISEEQLFLNSHNTAGKKNLRELEKQMIIETLQTHQHDHKIAASLLGLSTEELNRRIKDLQLS